MARFIVGDARAVMAALPPASVDLVITSPPFLALRSYLHADDESKHLEMGSEATPGEFIDALLDVTEAAARLLTPHGSLVVELGDTMSSGGGSDYADGEWRNGQASFRKQKSRPSSWSRTEAVWLAAMIDAEGAIYTSVDDRDENRRHHPSVAIGMRSEAVTSRVARITGVGGLTDKDGVFKWSAHGQQARYVLLHIWPYLMVKQEQAKAAIEMARHVEECRNGRGRPVTQEQIAYRESIREFIMNLNDKGGNRGRYPSDWTPPTPHRIRLPLVGSGPDWPEPKSHCMVPELYRFALAYGFNPLTGRETERWRVRNVIRWTRSNPPVGALGDAFRRATSEMVVACKSVTRWFDLDAVRTQTDRSDLGGLRHGTPKGTDERRHLNGDVANMSGSNPAGAPPLDWWQISPAGYPGAHYATWPAELLTRPVEAMCPRRVCTGCGQPSRRIVGDAEYVQSRNGGKPAVMMFRDGERGDKVIGHGVRAPQNLPTGDASVRRSAPTTGWSTCGCPGADGIRLDGWHTGESWRPGMVCDPFAGTGTTGLVATGHGRDATLIDLDPRNLDLARQRIGMFLVEASVPAAT
jgi:hypothetical protein